MWGVGVEGGGVACHVQVVRSDPHRDQKGVHLFLGSPEHGSRVLLGKTLCQGSPEALATPSSCAAAADGERLRLLTPALSLMDDVVT